ncbi:MAG: hypothetical protein JJE30_01760 [Desulfuromonadales bacterium]|nr:hypothetical protein [Desulfuromonadales bacterium]
MDTDRPKKPGGRVISRAVGYKNLFNTKGTRVFEEYNNLALGTFVPNRLHVTINAMESAIGAEGYNGVEFHEVWHYFQTCMTPFGQKSWNIYRQGIGFILSEYMNLITTKGSKPRLPLGYFASEGRVELANSFLWLNTFIASAGIAAARSSVSDKYKYVSDLSIMLYPYDWLICPEISVEGRIYRLQGTHIIEGHAIFIEALYSNFFNQIPIQDTLDPTKVPYNYLLCLNYFSEQLGSDRLFELPIVCDLALQAYWNEPVTSEEDWQASHPGWRFVRIIQEIINNGIKLNSNDPYGDYDRYCDAILRACGYSSLKDSLDAAAEFYSGHCLLKTEERMLEALKFRKDNLSCGANPFLNIKSWMEMKKFKPSTIHRNGHLEVTVEEAEEMQLKGSNVVEGFMLETIGEIHFQAFIAQLLGKKHEDCENDQYCCGYKYFNINGCFFQAEGVCTGILTSGVQMPVESSVDCDENFKGCFFEMVFLPYGLSVSDFSIDFTQKLPTLDELKDIAMKLNK